MCKRNVSQRRLFYTQKQMFIIKSGYGLEDILSDM